MSDELSNDQIALLCGIEEQEPPKLVGDKKRDLEQLVAAGYVEPAGAPQGHALRLTAKGIAFLGARGAGLNEA
jgi:hypothetical protein